MKTNKTKTSFGKDWTEGQLNFPKHLAPEVIHTALFIHNAPSKEDIIKRTEHCSKLIGGEAMTYAMALLVLPNLIDNTMNSQDYKDFIASKKKTIN
jgi:hypothetical protein|tara:strand:+ start:314 stop:601 length:288 start_codon:yes stop_codon:yes gene_type:complete